MVKIELGDELGKFSGFFEELIDYIQNEHNLIRKVVVLNNGIQIFSKDELVFFSNDLSKVVHLAEKHNLVAYVSFNLRLIRILSQEVK